MTSALPSVQQLLLQSPFEIPHEDIEALSVSEGFQVLRRFLAQGANNEFCSFHSKCDTETRETWLLHRDILHALLMPIVELFKRASALAEAALPAHQTSDLELAFGGDARSAFLWLQCFLTEEEAWCRTQNCPGCVTTATLSTESHIRLTIAASLLSTAPLSSPPPSPPASTPGSPGSPPLSPVSSNDVQSPQSSPTLSLPPIPHILPALRDALSSDPFWGPDYFPYLMSRATVLSAGIQALIGECFNLDYLVSCQEVPKAVAPPAVTSQQRLRKLLNPLAEHAEEEKSGLRLRKSKLAKRQLRMKGEQMDLLRRCALQCWAAAAIPSKVRSEILGRRERRVRSLTCPV